MSNEDLEQNSFPLQAEAHQLKKANRLSNETEIKTPDLSQLVLQAQQTEMIAKDALESANAATAMAGELGRKSEARDDETSKLQDSISQTHNLVVVGLVIILIMVAAIIVSVVIFEIQAVSVRPQ